MSCQDILTEGSPDRAVVQMVASSVPCNLPRSNLFRVFGYFPSPGGGCCIRFWSTYPKRLFAASERNPMAHCFGSRNQGGRQPPCTQLIIILGETLIQVIWCYDDAWYVYVL